MMNDRSRVLDAPKERTLNEQEILGLMQDDLLRVEEKMHAMSSTAFAPVGEAFLHLIGSGGKRLRPFLALIAYRLYAAGEPGSERAVSLAAAVETLHNATLVHDDLIDESLLRRGRTTLNATWTKGATVLAGDYLFARAATFAAETENIRVVKLFAETLSIICDGELRQLFSSKQWRQPKDAYYQRIFAKTASLFAAATRSGAILGGAPDSEEQALYDFGYNLGMAFQIVDDILDYTGDEAVLGKPTGSDLRHGTVTLPFFYFLQNAPDAEAIVASLESGDGAVAEAVAAVRASDAVPLAHREARAFVDSAKANLAVLPDGLYRRALSDLADFVVARKV